jgi:SAM-dependent methyltransferase
LIGREISGPWGTSHWGAAGIPADLLADSEFYQPARPRHIREALRAVPVKDFSEHSYVDLGSGKGRTLFVAAELPFREVIGVEFSGVLHDQACANIRTLPEMEPALRSDHVRAWGCE